MNETGFKNVISYAADEVALAALQARKAASEQPRCNLCEQPILGKPAASGLFMWTRGDDVRFDEPPLCAGCTAALTLSTSATWPFGEPQA